MRRLLYVATTVVAAVVMPVVLMGAFSPNSVLNFTGTSAVDGVPVFDNTKGKSISDSGVTITNGVLGGLQGIDSPVVRILDPLVGQLELGPTVSSTAAPYIDLHHGQGVTQDFNVRIQNSDDQRLSIIGITDGTLALFGHIPQAPGLPGGPFGSNAAVLTGSTTLTNWFPTSFGDAATTLCVKGARYASVSCPVLGSLETDPTSAAWYPDRDTVGAVIAMSGMPAWFKDVPGTFAAGKFLPTDPLTSDQLSKLRYGQVLDTNDSPKCSGKITSWTSTEVDVAGWYKQGFAQGSTPACTPVGTAATVGATKFWGLNVVNDRQPTNQQFTSVNYEAGVLNNSGTNGACPGYDFDCAFLTDSGIDVVSLGANRGDFGYQVRGNFYSQVTLSGDSTYGVLVGPPSGKIVTDAFRAWGNNGGGNGAVGIALSAIDVTEAWRNWNNNGDIGGHLLGDGNLNLGWETGTATNFVNKIFSSASGTADATWIYSGGSGGNNGMAELQAGLFVVPEMKLNGHVISSGTAPAVSACGT